MKPTTDWNDLSNRQQQVAQLLAGRFSVSEMSQQLHLAKPGVQFHIFRLFEITGSHDRASFLAWMAANGPAEDEENS